MSSLESVVSGYVTAMRPKGEAFIKAFAAWPEADVALLIAEVHKFAGSAGSAGFTRLSAVATLLEIGLRALPAGAPPAAADEALLHALGADFAAEIAALSPARSSLISGDEVAVYPPFARPLRVVLSGLPPAADAVFAHVVEQRMGIAFSVPDVAALGAAPRGRGPDLAVVAAPTAAAFPVYTMDGGGFAALTGDWIGSDG